VTPSIFLAVAAFLLNVVLSRLVGTQREQIAVLKAVGYSKWSIALHFLKLVAGIVVVGVAIGTLAGAWLGAGMLELYADFFNFPVFRFHFDAGIIVLALLASAGAAVIGTASAVRGAARLPAAEAMRPKPPAAYRPTILERSGLAGWLTPAARMVLRQLERRPVRALLSCTTIALATSVLVLGEYMDDSIKFILNHEFERIQRHDVSLTLIEPRAAQALTAISHLPGVRLAEPFRALPVRVRSQHVERRVGIMALDDGRELFRPLNADGEPIYIPPDGVVLSEKLGEVLGVGAGDTVTIEVLEGDRPVREVAVAGLVSDYFGLTGYAHIQTANRVMRQDRVLNGAYVACEPGRLDELYHELRETPGVAGVTVRTAAIQSAGVTVRTAAIQSFRDTLAETLLLMKGLIVIFAVIIAVGVVYNTARVSLSERNRELATLRVIGFSRREISIIQLGELAVLTLVGIGPGLLLGYTLAFWATRAFDMELFRLPLVIDRSTYAFAASVVMAAALASGLVVRRMLDRLDLVAVLKSRE
jgi:putative ABC transport system permease protein